MEMGGQQRHEKKVRGQQRDQRWKWGNCRGTRYDKVGVTP